MKKYLKINNYLSEIIVSQELIPLLFVNDSSFIDGWIYNFFYDIVVENEMLVFSDNDCFDKAGCFLYYAYNFPVARSRDYAPVSKEEFVKRLRSFIDDGKYIVAIYNNPEEKNRFLLYGYDDDQECFVSYIFKKDRFVKEVILYNVIMDSIIEQVCNIVDGRIEVRCFRENPYYKKNFDYNAMLEKTKVFLNGMPVGSGKMGLYDIEGFLKVLAGDGKYHKFKKSLKCLEQHLLFMNERLNYVSKSYDTGDDLGTRLGSASEQVANAVAAIKSLGNTADTLPVMELKQEINHIIGETDTAYQSILESYRG